ncbi:MAG: hypothetical protein NTW21_39610 [Verrucomicrobia bacterium]|nr:hypothetical protein [Verrucomicrobiota bacterium]
MILPADPGEIAAVLPGTPSGFADTSSAVPLWSEVGGTLLDGFTFSTTFSSTYNSNVSASQRTTDDSAKDDFILALGGSAGYLSKSSGLTFGGNYHGYYDQYFNHSDYSGYSQGGGLVANYAGGRFSVSADLGIDLGRGSNTNYSSNFVEQTRVNTGLTARYQLSPKTSLQGNFGQNFTTASGGRYSDTTSYDLGVSALWRYSALTEFGPGLRYTYRSGSSQTQTGRTSIGPTVNVNYKLTSKVALNSQLGMDFSSYDNGGSADPTVSANIGLNYQASELWGMNLSLYRDTQADTSRVGGFTQLTSLRVGYHRKVRRAMWNLGVGYQANSYEMPGNAAGGTRPDQDNFNIDTSLSMPVFGNTCNARVFIGYRDQSGGSARNSWDSVQGGFSLSRSF